MKMVTLIILTISLFSGSAFSANKMVCVGDDGRDSSFTIRLVQTGQGKAVAEVDENWAGGEELNTDTVNLAVEENANRVTYSQVGLSKEKEMAGFKLLLSRTHKPKGLMLMKATPRGRKSDLIQVKVSCK